MINTQGWKWRYRFWLNFYRFCNPLEAAYWEGHLTVEQQTEIEEAARKR